MQTITGLCVGLTEKAGGWHEFQIDIGKQYPVKLATKQQEIVELGRAAMNGSTLATWTYNEVESDKINPHSNKPYVNRYLEGVEVGGSEKPTGSVATPGSAAQVEPGLLGAAKDRSIVRQTCIKAAAALWAPRGVEPDPALEVMKTAARFEQWIYRDVDEVPFD